MRLNYMAGRMEKKGVTFTVVQVNSEVFDVPGRAMDTMNALRPEYPDMAIVLMSRNKKGVPVFFGRPDLVNGLGDAALRDVKWTEETLEVPDVKADS